MFGIPSREEPETPETHAIKKQTNEKDNHCAFRAGRCSHRRYYYAYYGHNYRHMEHPWHSCGRRWCNLLYQSELAETLVYADTDTLSFTFDTTNNGTDNSCLTLALIGSTNAIVLGHGSYNTPGDAVQVAVTSSVSVAGGYVFAPSTPTDDLTLTAGATLNAAMPANGATSTISGTISWDGDSYALGSSATNATLTYDLGITTLDVSKIMVTIEGGGAPDNNDNSWKTPTMSNLRISTPAVPEPTTATLSLLALAGLAARRRK